MPLGLPCGMRVMSLVFGCGVLVGTAGDEVLRRSPELELPGPLAAARDALAGAFQAHSQPGKATAAVAATGPGPCLTPSFIADAAAKAAPAVVNIVVNPPAGGAPIGSSGSGFITEWGGGQATILTNAHVVADAIQRQHFNGPGGAGGAGRTITVTLQDGRIFEGRLQAYDIVSDLAVVRVESDLPLPTVQLGRSHRLQAGQWVLALGSPLHLQNSVAAGIISCVDRKAVELGLAGARTDFIQTDAAINKGNSGGPLVDLEGRVIGISAMKAVAADGVSFAIPIDTAVEVVRQLAEHGRVIRPYVGIKMLQLNVHNTREFRKRDPNFPDVSEGILVPHVAVGSPAERAGLKPGDVIVGYAGSTRGATTSGLIHTLGEHVGRPMELRVVRPGGVTALLSVTALEASDGLHH